MRYWQKNKKNSNPHGLLFLYIVETPIYGRPNLTFLLYFLVTIYCALT